MFGKQHSDDMLDDVRWRGLRIFCDQIFLFFSPLFVAGQAAVAQYPIGPGFPEQSTVHQVTVQLSGSLDPHV